ncbi:hypothetical protein HZA73_03195 [candidate division TA06 bacterium]|nr:hypothetical protein [candidate division TA06 bacterium]
MKKILTIIFTLSLAAGNARAAFEDWQVGIRANAMSGAYTSIADDIEAVRWNPAGLAQLDSWQASAYAKRLWGVAGLTNQTASLGRSFGKWGGAAVSVQQVGCDLESDQAVTLSHGFGLNDQLSFGYNFNFYRIWQQDFGSAMTLGIDVGMMAKVYRTWKIGCFGHNLNHPSLGKIYQYDLPSGVSAGVSCIPFSGVTASAEAGKDVGKLTRYKFGAEYGLWQDKLALRAGILSEGQLTLYDLGFGVNAGGILVGYAFEGGHQALPGTHQIGLGYKW